MSQRSPIVLKTFVWIGCLVPLAWMIMRGFEIGSLSLGPNPVEAVLHAMGKTSLNILLLTLAVTPVRRITRLGILLKLRRLLGLFSFFYLVLHLLIYAVLDLRLQWNMLATDITERPYITLGMLAFVGMIALAITSTRSMQRRLGRNWGTLHKAIYLIAILGVVHFQWQTKGDRELEPWIYGAILLVLLGYRLVHRLRST